MQFYATTYLKIELYFSRSILGLEILSATQEIISMLYRKKKNIIRHVNS